MSAVIKIDIQGIKQFSKAVKSVDKALAKELRLVHKKVAVFVAGRASTASPARTKGAIRPRATQTAAKIALTPGRRGDALGVFMGQTRRSGWYGKGRYRKSQGRQFDRWVGNQYTPGDSAGKPYFIGDAINSSIDEAVEMFAEGLGEVAKRAGFS